MKQQKYVKYIVKAYFIIKKIYLRENLINILYLFDKFKERTIFPIKI